MEPAMQAQMRQEVTKSLADASRRVDPAALARQADFAAEGMKPTAGQITRDAGQYAKERNLRTLSGVGDPLLQRFEQQGQQMQEKMGRYASGASENFSAGQKLAQALKAKDEELRSGVSAAYKAARESAGKDAEIPLGGLATDAADVLDRFGDKVPSGVLNQLKKYGVLPDQVDKTAPRKLFTVEAADDLIKTINANQSSDPAVNTALGQLRSAVKRSITQEPSVAADEIVSAKKVLPPHAPDDPEKLSALVESMKKEGWKGRPVVAMKYRNQIIGITGSHRIQAAADAGIDVPLVYVEPKVKSFQDPRGLFGNFKRDVVGTGDDRVAKFLDMAGDKRAASLLKMEDALNQGLDPGAVDVFAPARKLAAERFKLQDAVPALEAAATGSTAPDDFVKRFVLNGKTNEVKGLADILKQSSPEAYQEARAQIGAQLQRAAYGENIAGDKAFSPERYAKALRDMGSDKLKAFFEPEEISQLQRLSRIGAYINSMPNASPVQSSNNWGAIMGMASKIPGVSPVVGLANAAKTTIGNQSAVNRALAAEVPQVPGKMTPEQIAMVAKLLGGTSAAAGAAAAQPLK
jgi:hypothetical protein